MSVSAHQREMFAARVNAIDERLPGYRQAWQRWEQRLLAHGGDAVVALPDPEEALGELLEHARVSVPGRTGTLLLSGRPSDCHGNVARLWTAKELPLRCVATGYALSDDGLWRQHSWAVQDNGAVVETTEVREMYAGVCLDAKAADRFAAANR